MAEPTVNFGAVAMIAAGFSEIVGVDIRHAVFAAGAYAFFQIGSLRNLTRWQALGRGISAGLLGAAVVGGAGAYFELAHPAVQLMLAVVCGALLDKLPKWATAYFEKVSGVKNGQ